MGHTGTLDPFATGLLVVLLGRATRLARFVEADRKTYLATARLGVVTSTDDLTGEELGDAVGEAAGRDRAAIEQTLSGFLGPQRQRPPAYSAKHVKGERSYALARRGEAVELPEVEVEIERMELVGYAWPSVQFRATVSAGTYLRALARDLGQRLGTGAHLTALRREAIGALRVEDAVQLDALSGEAVRPPLAVLGELDRLAISEAEARDLGYGNSIAAEGRVAPSPGRHVAAVAEGDRLVAVGHLSAGRFHPEVVLEAQGA